MYPLWFLWLFWIGVVVLYMFIAGATYKLSLAGLQAACYKCSNGVSCFADHEIAPFFIAIGWPLGVPLVLGVKSASRVADRLLTMKAGKE